MTKKEMDVNKRHWDEVVPLHVASRFYDVEGFLKGRSSLLPVEAEEVGDVRRRSLLHLQCHFGMDTLSWARKGAVTTGVDYSIKAVEEARKLSSKIGVEARFIESNIYDLGEKLDEQFDIVFTSYGVLCWLPNLEGWAETIAHFLKDGGFFYIVEDHPVAQLVDEHASEGIRVKYPYFTEGKPTEFRELGSYTDRSAKLDNSVTYEWTHTMADIVNSLIRSGLCIDYLHEFPFSFFKRHDDLEPREDGTWHFKDPRVSFPMMFSLRATKARRP